MIAVQAQRGLYSWFYQKFWFLEVSKLCRTVRNISTSRNKVSHAVRRAKRKQSAVQKNVENKEPVLSQGKRNRSNLVNPLFRAANNDLSETEMKILTTVIRDILVSKMQSRLGKMGYEKLVRGVLNNHKPVPLEVTPLKPLESIISNENYIKTPKPPEFLCPLWNTLTKMTREEAIVHLKSKIPDDLHIGEEVASSTHILERTRSNSILPDSQKILLSNEDKLALERHLSLHMEKYIEEKTPPEYPDPELPKHLLAYWRSMQHVIRKITEVKGFDVQARHPVLHYTATADIICSFDGYSVMMDWKTHIGLTNSSLSASDYTLQAAACVGALNFDVTLLLEEPLHAVSLVSYPSGKPGHALFMNSAILLQYWKNWLERFSMFYREQNKL